MTIVGNDNLDESLHGQVEQSEEQAVDEVTVNSASKQKLLNMTQN
jgi:hypothetical protein